MVFWVVMPWDIEEDTKLWRRRQYFPSKQNPGSGGVTTQIVNTDNLNLTNVI